MSRLTDSNCRGHTLVELLFTMVLSVIIISALISAHSLSLRSIKQQQRIEQLVNRLGQTASQIESDIKLAGLTGCLQNKLLIRDALFQQSETLNGVKHAWISGFGNNIWSPGPPFYDNNTLAPGSDAINVLYADVSVVLPATQFNRQPERVVFISNCLTAEIVRFGQSEFIKDTTNLQIHPFQSVLYYIKRAHAGSTLYRQYLTISGTTLNEPLVDNVANLRIAYGEKLSDGLMAFRAAQNVDNWRNIAAVYIQAIVSIDTIYHPVAMLVPLLNHET